MQPDARKKSSALIAFGANQGDCESALRGAIAELESDAQILELQCSQALQTKAVTGNAKESASQGEYLNAAIGVLTTYTARELHRAMMEIEKKLGREREQRWGERNIDLDLLLFSDLQLREKDLVIPHPRMSFRRFVLLPALEIAADSVHPESGKTIRQLIDHLDQSDPLILLATNALQFAQTIATHATHDPAAEEISIVQDSTEFMNQALRARLVVACFDEEKTDQPSATLARFAHNFAGPTLRIDMTLGEKFAARELRAAIEAMQ